MRRVWGVKVNLTIDSNETWSDLTTPFVGGDSREDTRGFHLNKFTDSILGEVNYPIDCCINCIELNTILLLMISICICLSNQNSLLNNNLVFFWSIDAIFRTILVVLYLATNVASFQFGLTLDKGSILLRPDIFILLPLTDSYLGLAKLIASSIKTPCFHLRTGRLPIDEVFSCIVIDFKMNSSLWLSNLYYLFLH